MPKPGRELFGPVWPKPVMRSMTSFGLIADSTSQPMPQRSNVPGRKFSQTMSASRIRRFTASTPKGVRMSMVTDRLLRLMTL